MDSVCLIVSTEIFSKDTISYNMISNQKIAKGKYMINN